MANAHPNETLRLKSGKKWVDGSSSWKKTRNTFSPSTSTEFHTIQYKTDVNHLLQWLPYRQRKYPDQLDWIEWLYIAITI